MRQLHPLPALVVVASRGRAPDATGLRTMIGDVRAVEIDTLTAGKRLGLDVPEVKAPVLIERKAFARRLGGDKTASAQRGTGEDTEQAADRRNKHGFRWSESGPGARTLYARSGGPDPSIHIG